MPGAGSSRGASVLSPERSREFPFDSPADARPLRRKVRYWGPGLLISVGYMDPGNWATDIEAGSKFGYGLLFVVFTASLAAMLLQLLCVRLGLATSMDLAQACRQHYSKRAAAFLWLAAEVSIIACDLAEVLGSALALHLLFGLILTSGDHHRFRDVAGAGFPGHRVQAH